MVKAKQSIAEQAYTAWAIHNTVTTSSSISQLAHTMAQHLRSFFSCILSSPARRAPWLSWYAIESVGNSLHDEDEGSRSNNFRSYHHLLLCLCRHIHSSRLCLFRTRPCKIRFHDDHDDGDHDGDDGHNNLCVVQEAALPWEEARRTECLAVMAVEEV
jgi:hypothetical protein